MKEMSCYPTSFVALTVNPLDQDICPPFMLLPAGRPIFINIFRDHASKSINQASGSQKRRW